MLYSLSEEMIIENQLIINYELAFTIQINRHALIVTHGDPKGKERASYAGSAI